MTPRRKELFSGKHARFEQRPNSPGTAIGTVAFMSELRPPGFGPGMFRNPGMNPRDGLWQMQIQHRAGSLEAAVANARRRNLAISFSILVLLGGSVISFVIFTRRAHRLAQQQVEFVAAATHELRTPIYSRTGFGITVLSSGGP